MLTIMNRIMMNHVINIYVFCMSSKQNNEWMNSIRAISNPSGWYFWYSCIYQQNLENSWLAHRFKVSFHSNQKMQLRQKCNLYAVRSLTIVLVVSTLQWFDNKLEHWTFSHSKQYFRKMRDQSHSTSTGSLKTERVEKHHLSHLYVCICVGCY